VKITGVKKGKISGIIDENKLTPGIKVTENLITTTKYYLENKYKKEGYLNAKALISTSKVIDSVEKTRVDMRIRIDKGQKVKIKKIAFYGNKKMSSKAPAQSHEKYKAKEPH
jgi:outer membrane protein insertion porin family